MATTTDTASPTPATSLTSPTSLTSRPSSSSSSPTSTSWSSDGQRGPGPAAGAAAARPHRRRHPRRAGRPGRVPGAAARRRLGPAAASRPDPLGAAEPGADPPPSPAHPGAPHRRPPPDARVTRPPPSTSPNAAASTTRLDRRPSRRRAPARLRTGLRPGRARAPARPSVSEPHLPGRAHPRRPAQARWPVPRLPRRRPHPRVGDRRLVRPHRGHPPRRAGPPATARGLEQGPRRRRPGGPRGHRRVGAGPPRRIHHGGQLTVPGWSGRASARPARGAAAGSPGRRHTCQLRAARRRPDAPPTASPRRSARGGSSVSTSAPSCPSRDRRLPVHRHRAGSPARADRPRAPAPHRAVAARAARPWAGAGYPPAVAAPVRAAVHRDRHAALQPRRRRWAPAEPPTPTGHARSPVAGRASRAVPAPRRTGQRERPSGQRHPASTAWPRLPTDRPAPAAPPPPTPATDHCPPPLLPCSRSSTSHSPWTYALK